MNSFKDSNEAPHNVDVADNEPDGNEAVPNEVRLNQKW